MNKLRQLSLLITLPSILFTIFFVMLGSLFFIEYKQDKQQLYDTSEQYIKGITVKLQSELSNLLIRFEKSEAQQLISSVAINESLLSIAVVDEGQQIMLSNHFKFKHLFAALHLPLYDTSISNNVISNNKFILTHQKENNEIVVHAPLQMQSKGNSLNRQFNAVIFLRYSYQAHSNELAYQAVIKLIKILCILLLAIVLMSYFSNRLVIAPLNRLAKTTYFYSLNNKVEIEQAGLGEIGRIQYSLSVLINKVIIELNKLMESEQRWLYAIRGSRDGVWDWNIENDTVYYSARWKEMLGYLNKDIANNLNEWEQRIHPDDLLDVFQAFKDHFEGAHSFFESTHRVLGKKGAYHWITARGQTVSWDDVGRPLRMVGTTTDITASRLQQAGILMSAQIDAATKLPNRDNFLTHISQEIVRSANSKLIGGVLVLGCDQYTRVTDLQGHDKGVELLSLIANRIIENKSCLDFVGHLTECNFAVILPELHSDQEQVASMILNFAHQLDSVLKSPFDIDGEDISLNWAYGVGILDENVHNASELLQQSTMAMNNAFHNDLSNICFFSTEIATELQAKHDLQGKIRLALNNNDFRLHFQPRADSNGSIVGAEALLRWFDQEEGWISPDTFINAAEESGLIIPLGEWVIAQTFKQLKQWTLEGLPPLFHTLSLNISPKQLLQRDFVTVIEKHLNDSKIDPQLIEIEITENTLILDMDNVIITLNKLRKIGFHFAIDDFGTGYSSFYYLSALPVSTLKIDKYFLLNLLQDDAQQVIVTAIINMAHQLHLNVVAEGVENLEQFQYLALKGCNQFQGYLIGSAMPSHDFYHTLQHEKLKNNKLELNEYSI